MAVIRSTKTSSDLYQEPLQENPEIGTKFKPEPPFEMYTRGFVYLDKRDHRRIVVLQTPMAESATSSSIQCSMFVSRYLHATKLYRDSGSLIPDGYEVDHINDNRLDDRFDNFQLLTSAENFRKERLRQGSLWCTMICPVCSKRWNARFSNSPHADYNDNHVFCCSRECKIVLNATLFPYSRFEDLRLWISNNQVYQVIRKWQNKDEVEVVRTVSEKMLSFDLAVVSGQQLRTDAPMLMDRFLLQEKVHRFRNDGLTWDEIGNELRISAATAQRQFKDNTMLRDNGGRFQTRNMQMKRMFNDEKISVADISRHFGLRPITVEQIVTETGSYGRSTVR
jgi:hypothetical protein